MFNTQLAVIMPVYNEEEIIEVTVNEWLEELRRLNIDFKFCIYNDGSNDNTLAILKKLKNQSSELIIHDKPNSGHGPTILKGYKDKYGAQWIFQTDSDRELTIEIFEELWNQKDNKE